MYVNALVCTEAGKRGNDGEMIPFDELDLIEVVGSGHSGSLWRAKWKDMLVAVKMIKVRKDLRVFLLPHFASMKMQDTFRHSFLAGARLVGQAGAFPR